MCRSIALGEEGVVAGDRMFLSTAFESLTAGLVHWAQLLELGSRLLPPTGEW
jgi:hypothetical protein